jgi:hypothetical protein
MLYWRLSYFVDPFTMPRPPASFAQERGGSTCSFFATKPLSSQGARWGQNPCFRTRCLPFFEGDVAGIGNYFSAPNLLSPVGGEGLGVRGSARSHCRQCSRRSPTR